MRAQMKQLHSPDVHHLEDYSPPVRDSFSFLLQILAGPEGDDSRESFDVTVCTPKWMMERLNLQPIMPGRNYLIVKEYDYVELKSFIESYCTQCSGESWQDVAQKVGRLGKWEFEDYVL